METEDFIYLLLLVFSIPFGHMVKLCGRYENKKFISCITGLCLVLLLCGKGILHSLIVILGNYVIVKIVGLRYCRWLSFVYVFFYLFVMRMLTYYDYLEHGKYTNATQLLVTLRMVSLPFELYNMDKEKKDEKDNSTKKQSVGSIYDFFAYGYCYIGLMTGPFYTFNTFNDMLVKDHSKTTTVIPALKNLKLLPFFLVAYALLNKYFPIRYLHTDDYLNHSGGVIYQILILAPTFTTFRWRFYIAWLCAESACMTAGLGAYPLECEAKSGGGPTKQFDASSKSENDVVYGFQTICNVNIHAVEFAPTITVAMRNWNTTVQWWLATYVYKELPIPSRQIRMFILVFVSAFWHGVHPGYYVTFLTVPFVVIAEKRMIKALTPYLDDNSKYYFDWVSMFCLYRSFEYHGIGFLLLDLKSILRVWCKTYFIGPAFILLFILLPIVIPRRRPEQSDQLKKD